MNQRVDVERFKATGDYVYPIEEHPDGNYVLYDDYAALLQQVAEQAERLEAVELSWHHELERRIAAERARGEAQEDVKRWRWMHEVDAALMASYGAGGRCVGYYVITGDEHHGSVIHDVKPTEREAIDAAFLAANGGQS